MRFGELVAAIKSDIDLKKRWFLYKDTWFNRNVRVYFEPGTIAVILYRYGSWIRSLRLPLVKQICFAPYLVGKAFVVLAFSIYIPSRLIVGRGFAIHNFSGIFLPTTTVGNNFIVFQGVTVGHLRGQGGKPPRIGDNVLLAAGAKVMGDITVGSNVVVGANSLVVSDIPDNCTVIGVPARIVSRDTSWIAEKLDGKGDHW